MAAQEELKCILLTLQSENVIVPNAAVAEIIPSRDVQQVDGAPVWMLGKMSWRGYDVPLVSFEAAADESGNVSTSTQIAILYSLNEDTATPYIGLAISGVPHVSFFTRDQIHADPSAIDDHPMVVQKIRVNGASASILDIQSMEEMVHQHLPGVAQTDV